MRLADYLADRQLMDATFAAQIGVSRQAVGRYKFGDRRPEWAVLQRIVEATDGHVMPNDFLDASELTKPVACSALQIEADVARAG